MVDCYGRRRKTWRYNREVRAPRAAVEQVLHVSMLVASGDNFYDKTDEGLDALAITIIHVAKH